MKSSLNKFKKLFPFFILPLFVWAIGVGSNPNTNTGIKSQVEFHQDNNTANFFHYHTLEVEESEFVFIESEPEFEVELDWFLINSKAVKFKNTDLKQSSNSYTTLLLTSKETIPLYDLYCNWKFHLS